jgi:hypothetical protein
MDYDKIFWDIVKEINFIGNRGNYIQAYNKLSEKYQQKYLNELRKIGSEKARQLYISQYKFTKYKITDDNVWDLICVIISLGKDVYEKVMKEKDNQELDKIVKMCNGNFHENFLYCFNP